MLLLLLGACAPVAAVPGDPLDPEKAFPALLRLLPGGIDIDFRIAEGYYLYRDRFRVATAPAGLPLGPPRLPEGLRKDDPFIGTTEILVHSARVHLPFEGAARPGDYTVTITAQGCAEERVCYAPFSQTLKVRIR